MRLSTLFEPRYEGAVAVVTDGTNLLMGRATNNDGRRGLWALPGGGIEPGESPEKAAERECAEETGVRCKAVHPAVPTQMKPGIAFVLCKKTGGAFRPNEEFSELNWIPIANLFTLEDVYQPNLPILKELLG